MKRLTVRKALTADAPMVNDLLSEWFDWSPGSGRMESINRAIRNGEILVAQSGSRIVGFIHYVMHEDIIDGGPNSFISSFYVTPACRGKGIGSLLLEDAITDSLARGVVGVETSTTHAYARELYLKHNFKQAFGDIGEVFLELDIGQYQQAQGAKKG